MDFISLGSDRFDEIHAKVINISQLTLRINELSQFGNAVPDNGLAIWRWIGVVHLEWTNQSWSLWSLLRPSAGRLRPQALASAGLPAPSPVAPPSPARRCASERR